MAENQNDPINDKATAKEATRMPEDFWQLVQQTRALAQAQVARRRQKVYQTFTKQVEAANTRIPMPEDFWEAISSEVKITVSLPSEPFPVEIQTQEPTIERENLPLWGYDKDKNSYQEVQQTQQTQQTQIVEDVQQVKEVKEVKEVEENKKLVEENTQEEEFIEVEGNEIIYLEQDTQGLTFKEAALMILTREKRPMTAREIANIAISEGLVISAGKTPDASVAGQIYTDIRRNPNKTPFTSVGSRTYALKAFYNYEENNWKAPLVNDTSEPMLNQEDAKGTVISGNFPWQEEKSQQATKPSPSDSKLEIEVSEQVDSSVIVDDDKAMLELENNSPIAEQISDEESVESVIEATSENKKMGFKQAALYILKRMRRPMTAREIVAIAIEESLIDSTSKKPDSSLSGQIYTELQKIGEKSVFRQIGPRTYGLAEWYKDEK